MANANMAVWDAVKHTDPAYTKQFKKSGFSGTDIDPMFTVKQLTEMFGPCGIGWGYRVVERWTDVDPTSDKTNAQVMVEMWVKAQTNTFVHIGSCPLMYSAKSGNRVVDDEAWKKALTNALSKATGMLGCSADVRMGVFDDSKYQQSLAEKFASGNATVSQEPKSETQTQKQSARETQGAAKAQGEKPADPRDLARAQVEVYINKHKTDMTFSQVVDWVEGEIDQAPSGPRTDKHYQNIFDFLSDNMEIPPGNSQNSEEKPAKRSRRKSKPASA